MSALICNTSIALCVGFGTALVLLFSDPMVDVLSEMANRIGIPPFYVAFVLAPLVRDPNCLRSSTIHLTPFPSFFLIIYCAQASNASELIAAYNYALKKTKSTITISLMTLTV